MMNTLITQNLSTLALAVKNKSASGRGSSKKIDLYGIKKLRELILELAVRGKLVPQNPEDEPASRLLERIEAEKARLVKEKKIKKLPKIAEDEKSFDLPQGWTYGYMPQVVAHSDYAIKRGPFGSALKKAYFVPYGKKVYEQQHAIKGDFSLGEYYISEEKFSELKAFEVKPNDLIISCSGTVGRVAIAPEWMESGVINQALLKITLNENALTNRYFKILFPAFFMQTETLSDLQGTAQKNMVSVDTLKNEPFPLPPLSEQHRIVTKVDELMALCDQIEQQTEASLSAHTTLVENLLTTLTSSINAEELKQNWQRIASHFTTLFSTEKSIDQLKQTILQLAVMGKLVPQNPNDEPATKLLERIAAEKAQLIKEGKIKKQMSLPPIANDEKPFVLPIGWDWVRVGDVIALKHGYAFKSKFFVEDESPYILTTPGNFYEKGGFRDRGTKTKYYDGPLEKEFILESGDMIIPMTEQAPGLLGSAAFIPNDGKQYLHNQRLGKLTMYGKVMVPEFVFHFFNSRLLRNELARTCSGTTVRHTSPAKILNALIPTCSSEEQHRIVTKVDELMALCDQIKTHLQHHQQTRLHLTDAMVEQALS